MSDRIFASLPLKRGVFSGVQTGRFQGRSEGVFLSGERVGGGLDEGG